MLRTHKRNVRLLALMLALMLLPLTGAVPARASATAGSYVITTINAVSLRQTAQSTGEVLNSLPDGTVLPVLDAEDGWYYVSYQGDYGFVASAYTRPLTDEEVAEYLLRDDAVPAVMPALEDEADEADDLSGLIGEDAAEYLNGPEEEEEPLEAEEEADGEGIYDEAAAEAEALTEEGDEETLFSAPDDEELIDEGVYFEQTSEPVLAYVSTPKGGTLTLRNDRSTQARAITYLPNGAYLYVLDMDSTWAQVLYEDVTGYVLAEYVIIADAEEEAAETEQEGEALDGADEAAEEAEESVFCATVRTGDSLLELRATPDDNGVVIARIQDGATLVILGQEGYYYLTVYGGMNGCVSMDLVEIDPGLTGKAPYVYVTNKTVNVRTEPNRNASVTDHVSEGDVLALWGSPYEYDGYTWYPVVVGEKQAYLRGDTCVMLSRNQLNNYQAYGIIPNQADTAASEYLMCVSRSVNVRAAAATTARSLGKLEEGDVLRFEDEVTAAGEQWYRITYHDQTAFVMGRYVKVMTNEEYVLWQQNSLPVEEQTVTAPQPADVRDESAGLAGMSSVAYTLKDKVYIRKSPSIHSSTVTQIARSDTYVTLLGEVSEDQDGGNYTWYQVEFGDYSGWMRSDMLYIYTEDEYDALFGEVTGQTAESPAADPEPEIVIPEDDDSDLIDMAFTVQDRVYLRQAPSVQSPSVAIVGSEHSYLTVLSDAKLDESGADYVWYEVQYNNVTGYVRGDLINLMTEAMWKATFGVDFEASSAVLEPAAEPEPVYLDSEVDETEQNSGAELNANSADETDTAYTLEDNVLMRKQPTMESASVGRIGQANTFVQLMSGAVKDSGKDSYTWYLVEYAAETGYVRSDMIHVVTNAEWDELFNHEEDYTDTSLDGGEIITPMDGDESGLDDYVTYETLRLGSTGDKVTALQQALFEQGYLSADDVTGEYNSATVAAVNTFQHDHNLTVDGVAGQMTQSVLFGTRSYDSTIYPVEKSNWYTGSIQHVWTRGSVAVITDVYTGLSFRARRLAGSYHADVEPLTAADTAVMCQIYGVSTAEDILSNKHWQRRPLWVTVGGRTYAASMYGVPHNYPDGDSIPDNQFSGQFCVHFVNSRVHRTGEVDAYHQQAIQYAYSHAPSKKK